jgi:hypothetical protein
LRTDEQSSELWSWEGPAGAGAAAAGFPAVIALASWRSIIDPGSAALDLSGEGLQIRA